MSLICTLCSLELFARLAILQEEEPTYAVASNNPSRQQGTALIHLGFLS